MKNDPEKIMERIQEEWETADAYGFGWPRIILTEYINWVEELEDNEKVMRAINKLNRHLEKHGKLDVQRMVLDKVIKVARLPLTKPIEELEPWE